MATALNQRGRAADAPMSVPLTNDPDPQHHLDIIAWLAGRRDIVVMAKDGTGMRGWGPGDDESSEAKTLAIPPGGHARIVLETGPHADQDPTLVASLIARGRLDIVGKGGDKALAGAKPHKEISRELRTRDLERQGERSGSSASMQAQVAVLAKQVADLTAMLEAKA